ncbi:MAG: formylglycine-generating enzyme family protein [Rhodospirillales bacterium]|nr:formylglycine-generating enzyme family protein [Rhodospirillales bacterium]
MLAVPAGSFLMGGAEPEERPRHTVAIARPFAIAVTELTWDQWGACAAAGACRGDVPDQGWGRGERPVINIAYADAQAYVAWLSRRSGKTYRLPSEAEWE